MNIGGVEVVERHIWGATAPLGPAMPGVADEAWFHHSVTDAGDDDDIVEPTDDTYGDMREIERIGVSRFGRFSYSFAFHPNGTVLMGAGFNIGAHTANRNSRSYGFVFIGNYETQPIRSIATSPKGAAVRRLPIISSTLGSPTRRSTRCRAISTRSRGAIRESQAPQRLWSSQKALPSLCTGSSKA